ncbi:MAG: universal stress protein, partial [Pyrinomonadaceae bacterium]
MMDIKRILCPTDLTTNSDQALRYALALTRAYESELIICYREAHGEVAGAAAFKEGPAAYSLAQGKAR